MMKNKNKKFVVGSFAIVSAIVYLIYAGVSSSSLYFLTVPEVIAQEKTIYGKGLRVEGKVVKGSIKKNDKTMNVVFNIGDEGSSIPVQYTGVVPDLFKDEQKVVVEGKLLSNGVFHANTLMTSCPSKYEAMKSRQEASL